jgi:hypothetical protein
MDRRHAAEHEMVAAFLKAEFHSPRFGKITREVLQRSYPGRSDLIENPDVSNQQDNLARIELLQLGHGYGANRLLFEQFPDDVHWSRVTLHISDLEQLKYANFPAWVELSGGTRLVGDGAHNIGSKRVWNQDSFINDNVKAVAEALRQGAQFPEIVLVESGDGNAIILEGHTRAKASVFAALEQPVAALLGSHPSMPAWPWY